MGKNNKRKTTEQFKQEVFDLVGNEYEVNSEYVNAKTKINFIHNIPTCMNNFDMTPSNFMCGQRCPECGKLKRKQQNLNLLKINKDIFYEEVFKETDGEYEVVGEYLGINKKISILHHVCNKVFDMAPINFRRGHRCTNEECFKMRHSDACASGKGNNFYEQFQSYSDEYEVLDVYYRRNTSLTFRHKICGCEFKMSPNSFFNTINNVYGIKCPDCLQQAIYNNRAKSKEQFQHEIDLISNNEYIVLGEYENSNTSILMKHITCGNTWNARPNNLLRGTGCPYCKRSKGERQIEIYLSKNNLYYNSQQVFYDLVGTGGGYLSYDFYLPQYNLLIEYQGSFHDGTADLQTSEQFEIQQEHDRRKREYAKSHGIKLLEIWYWDFDNIENILEQTLNEFKEVA